MKFLSIPSKNESSINVLKEYIKNNKPVFILIYLDGCGPCNITRPEWKKLETQYNELFSHLSKNDTNNIDNDILIVDMNQELLNTYFNNELVFNDITGFPTIRYIKNNKYQNYNNNRRVNDFKNWILNTLSKENNINSSQNSKIKGGGRGGGIFKRILNKLYKSKRRQNKRTSYKQQYKSKRRQKKRTSYKRR